MHQSVVAEQWLRHSWQSSGFRHQRSRVRIQASAICTKYLGTFNCLEKAKNKAKEANKAHQNEITFNIATGKVFVAPNTEVEQRVFEFEFAILCQSLK